MEEKRNVWKTHKKAELLSPAGSLETLKAVAAAGADAVYAAGNRFGARAYANNFTEEELLWAIDYLHLHGRRLYLTVNTLLKQEELCGELYDYLLPLYRQGLDGVIVQDLGVLAFLKERFPGLKLHASTQMFITGPEGAALAKKMGCSRIVPARELSLGELRQIRDRVDIEIEAFVHGALCYCYSGQCLLSSMLGGRSGNRGRCAQPCRLPYRTRDKEGHLLSPKDLCAIELLPELLESGVTSLKIEGRMKQAEYAAGVTGIYRKYLDAYYAEPDAYAVSGEDLKRLEDLGSRSGFTQGYYRKQNGPDMMAMERSAHQKSNDALQEEMRRRYLNQEIQEKINGDLIIQKDKEMLLSLRCGEFTVTHAGDAAQAAKSRPLEQAEIMERICKTGGSPFAFEGLEIRMEEELFLPVSALNRLRRDALKKLEEKILEGFRREEPLEKGNEVLRRAEDGNPQAAPYLAVSVRTLEQAYALLENPDIHRIYIDSSGFQREQEIRQVREFTDRVHRAGKQCFYQMPPVLRQESGAWYRAHIKELSETGVDGFLVGNPDGLGLLLEAGIRGAQIQTDSSLYVWSGQAREAFDRLGVSDVTLPLEQNGRELSRRGYEGGECVLYGYLPLMISAQCVQKNTGGCSRKPGLTWLTDRYGKNFPVINQCKDCVNLLYNSSPLSLLHQYETVRNWKPKGYRISFTIETETRMEEVLSYYRQGFVKKVTINREQYLSDYTNGHLKRGVE